MSQNVDEIRDDKKESGGNWFEAAIPGELRPAFVAVLKQPAANRRAWCKWPRILELTERWLYQHKDDCRR